MSKMAITGLVIVLAIFVAFWLFRPHPSMHSDVAAPIVPKLTQAQMQGESVFNKKCGMCHGKNGVGTKNGPPLVHRIYEPNHHADGSFFQAAKLGARAHHWQFGDMPPVPGIKDTEISLIVTYVRALQRANGIY